MAVVDGFTVTEKRFDDVGDKRRPTFPAFRIDGDTLHVSFGFVTFKLQAKSAQNPVNGHDLSPCGLQVAEISWPGAWSGLVIAGVARVV